MTLAMTPFEKFAKFNQLFRVWSPSYPEKVIKIC